MRLKFVVEIELERSEGKFESKDSLATQIQEAIENADYGDWTGDNEGTYSTVTWDVSREE